MALGRKTGGRTKGVPNKITAQTRAVFERMFHSLAPEAENWIRQTAEGWDVVRVLKDGSTVTLKTGADPGKAADLLLRLSEFFIPKLGRTELVGDAGSPVQIIVKRIGESE